MPFTETQKKRREERGRVQVNIELNLQDREDWKAYAESLGQTLPGMVRQAVRESMLMHNWQTEKERDS